MGYTVTDSTLPASGGGMAGTTCHHIIEWMTTHGMPPLIYVDDETNDTISITEETLPSVIDSLFKK